MKRNSPTHTACGLSLCLLLMGVATGLSQTREDLFAAIEADDAAKVEKILEAQPQLASEPDELGFTPLTQAAGAPALWKPIMARNPAVNTSQLCHITILQAAILNHDVELIEVLIAKGCRVSDQNMAGENAMHWLTHVSEPDLAKKIFAMIYAKAPELVDQAGTYALEGSTIENRTPLWNAVDRINPVVAELLVKHGADPNKQPEGPGSSAKEFLAKRLADEPNLSAELQAVAQAMGVNN